MRARQTEAVAERESEEKGEEEGERELVDFINYSIYTSYIFRMPLALDTQRRALCVREGEGLRGQCGVIFVSLIRAGVGQLVLAYCP